MMRHVSRIQNNTLNWLFESINLNVKIQIKYTDFKNQIADLSVKESFTRETSV